MLTLVMRPTSWQVVKLEFLYLYDIYYLQHNKDRDFKWYEITPLNVKVIKEERIKRKLRDRDEL